MLAIIGSQWATYLFVLDNAIEYLQQKKPKR